MIEKYRAWDGERYTYSDEHDILERSQKTLDEHIGDFFRDHHTCEIQAFTGLLDMEQKPIFEGDVISPDGDSDERLVVVFSHGAFGTVDVSQYPFDHDMFYKQDSTFVALYDHDLTYFYVRRSVYEYRQDK